MESLKASAANTSYPDKYDPKWLETIPNSDPSATMVVTLHAPEFSSLCEVTNQPDYGSIIVSYVPRHVLVESKSFKLYLFGFRNSNHFHERAVTTIGWDLKGLLDPWFLEVRGAFNPRGGISIDPMFIHSRYGSDYWHGVARDRLVQHCPTHIKYR